MEIFLGFYEFIEQYLRRVVETNINTWKMFRDYNTTFIALIPKEDNLLSFEKLGQDPYAMYLQIIF